MICVLISLLLFLTGCFNEEMDLTAYLETDGSVTLHINVQNVYSLEKNATKRIKAEQSMLDRLLNEERVPYMDLLYNGGAESVSVTVLREDVPYHYLIRARFYDLEDFLNMLVEDEHGFDVDMSLEGRKRWASITPSGLDIEMDDTAESDDDLDIRLIIADAAKIQTDQLPYRGTNSVMLTAGALRHPIRIEWTVRRKPDEPRSVGEDPED